MLKKPTPIATQPIYSGRIIEVSSERLRYANGREHDLDFVRHPGAAAVVAVDGSMRVCVVRQYRHGVTDFLWEIPAGKLDPGEAPEVCAVRELAEETAGRPPRTPTKNWKYSGCRCPMPWTGCCAASGTTARRRWGCGARNITCNCDGAPIFDAFGLT